MQKSAEAFRTISEVADWLGLQAHVLRFWESKFSQVKPVKRAGGRRYYRPADMLLLGGIRKLLHEDGMTIKGVQKILREEGIQHVARMSQPLDDLTAAELREEREGTAQAPEAEALSPGVSDAGPADAPLTILETEASEAAALPAQGDPDAGTAPDLEDFGAGAAIPEPAAPEADQLDISLDEESPGEPAAEIAASSDASEGDSETLGDTDSDLPTGPEVETGAATAEPEAAPKPLIVDISDGLEEAEIAAHPALLTHAVSCSGLSAEQAEAIRPLLARLKVHHDNLAALSGAAT